MSRIWKSISNLESESESARKNESESESESESAHESEIGSERLRAGWVTVYESCHACACG